MQENTAKYSELFGTFAWLTPEKAEGVCNFAIRQSLVFCGFALIQGTFVPDGLTLSDGIITTESPPLHLITDSFNTGCAVVCLGVALIAATAVKNQQFQQFICAQMKEKIKNNLKSEKEYDKKYASFFNQNPNLPELHQLYREAKDSLNQR
jgi:hypothetical protein